MKKILIINILIIIFVFIVIDYCMFSTEISKYDFHISYLQNMTKKIAVSEEYDRESLKNICRKRTPLNSDSNKKSVIFTGCSFIYGDKLEESQTLPYKLSKFIDNPIYNKGLSSRALNTTLAMLKLGIFFDDIKQEPTLFIYFYAGDFHILRLVMTNMPFEGNEFLYRIKNNKLERKKPPFIISRFISLYSINKYIYNNLLFNMPKYREYLKKLAILHFSETQNIVKSKYPNTKFMIIVYQESPFFEEIAKELESKGFIIVRYSQDIGINVLEDEYQMTDGHPTELIWDKTAQKLADILKNYL